MSRGFGCIKDLKKDLDVWKIAFRVLDSWIVTASNGNQHLELIIRDAKGDRVHVVTRYKDLEHWKRLIEEGKTYVLHNCLVFDNDAAFKHVDHPFKVVFGCGTKVVRNDKLSDIPCYEFRFKPFKEIQDGNFKPDVLYEIIGLIDEIVKTSVFGSGKKPCTNLVLKDEVGNLVDATLWDKYSVDLTKFLAERRDNGPVILILTHAQCKIADNGKPNVCNNWSGSRLLINLKHPVVERFRASLQAQGHGLGRTLCEGSSSSQRSQNNEFSNLSQVRAIGEFRNLIQNTYCITVGTTSKFNPNQFGWYYESCTKCPKASKSGSASYKCSCGEDVEVPLTRYKVVVQVVYEGDKSEFVFWDKECVQILGVTADTLRKTIQEVDEDDPMIYPTHLANLLGLELALRVKYQPYYHQSSVRGFSSDPTVIERIKHHLRPDGMQSSVQEVDGNVVNNDPTQLFELGNTSSSVECSKAIPIPVNIVGNNPTQSVKVEQKTSSGEDLKPVPVSMNIVCGDPTLSVKVEQMTSPAECVKSIPIPMQKSVSVCNQDGLVEIGSCTPAKRSFDDKCKDKVVSDGCDPTSLSSIKLAKCIKKE